MIDWGALLVPAGVLLVIPLVIIVGYRRSVGSIVVSGALAAVIFAAFWLVLGGTNSFFGNADNYLVRTLIFFGGVLLVLATWILSLNAAAQARRWIWVGLLLVSGYLTLAAIYASFSIQLCFSGSGDEFACTQPDTLRQTLIFVGYLACPVATLAYGIYGARQFGRRGRTLPDGLTVSSLHTSPTEDAIASPSASDVEGAG